MNAHRLETAFTENGKLSLENLPFKKGDEVEVIILERSPSKIVNDPYPLKGTVIHYDNPLEPVTMPED